MTNPLTQGEMQTTHNSATSAGHRKQIDAGATALNASVVSPVTLETKTISKTVDDTFIAEINRVVKPPKPLQNAEVFVRRMLLVSDERNQHGGKFPLEELRRVSELVIDAPVLIGHRKDRLPIARVFRAELVERQGQHWVLAFFYWLKDTAGAETLRANIDGGVYKDCSLGFTFARAECSVCQADIRFCGHHPQQSAVENNAEAPCYYYRDVQRALEISLVYRGATLGARVGTDLGISQESDPDKESDVDTAVAVTNKAWPGELSIERIASVTDDTIKGNAIKGSAIKGDTLTRNITESSNSLTLTYPLLDGLPVLVGRHDGETVVFLDDGSRAPNRLSSIVKAMCVFNDGEFLVYARLIGMRGKSKRTCAELLRFLADDNGPVRSLKLRTLALLRYEGEWLSAANFSAFQNSLRYLCAQKRNLCAVQDADSSLSITLHRETESIAAGGDGRFGITRRRLRPLVHAQISADATVTIQISSEDKSATAPDALHVTIPTSRREQQNDATGVVALAFDRLSSSRAKQRLINPRVVGRFGEYHTAEKLLSDRDNAKHHDGADVKALTLPWVSQPSAGVIALAVADDIEGRACELSAGSPVVVRVSDGEDLNLRVIHLQAGSSVIIGLLVDDLAHTEMSA